MVGLVEAGFARLGQIAELMVPRQLSHTKHDRLALNLQFIFAPQHKSDAMSRRKQLPPLTPRAREIVNFVINSVALGTHDNDAEIGAIAKQIDMSPARLLTTLNELVERGWVTIKHDFVYPTPSALLWQNPDMSNNEAARMVRSLK